MVINQKIKKKIFGAIMLFWCNNAFSKNFIIYYIYDLYMVFNQKIKKKFWCNNAFFGAIMHQKLCFYLLILKNRKKIFLVQ